MNRGRIGVKKLGLELGNFIQVGVTSVGCARQGYPGVYAEVNQPSIRSFILDAANR